MKKSLALISYIVIISLVLIGGVNQAQADSSATFIDFPDQKPYINKDNRTMIPVRFVSDSLGANLGWDGKNKVLTIQQGKDTVILKIGESVAKKNGKTVTFDTQAVIKNGRTMVPLRFVSEALGADVKYDGPNSAVYIYTADKILGVDLDKNKFKKETLSDSEALELIIDAETKAIEVLSNSFVETPESYRFDKSLNELMQPVAPYYNSAYLKEIFTRIYNKPNLIVEYGYEFPLAKPTTPDDYHVVKKENKIDVYVETTVYEPPSLSLQQYTLTKENGKWKISSSDSLLTPYGAERAVRIVEGIRGDKIQVDYGGAGTGSDSVELDDYIQTILNDGLYRVQVYIFNEHATATYGWYYVDPKTRMVYLEDIVEMDLIELGKPY